MLSIMKAAKSRRAVARGDRAMWHIINTAGTPAMRDELIIMHQRQIDTLRSAGATK